MGESKLIVQILSVGSDVRPFTKEDGGIGYVARAFAKSGRAKEDKTWGQGFMSFSPRLGLKENALICGYNPKRGLYFEGDTERADARTCSDRFCDECKYLRPNILAKGTVFEGELRTNKAGMEYLALYGYSTEAPTHTVIRFTSNVEGDNPECEVILSTTGKVLSSACSTNSVRSSNEELVLVIDGDELISNKNNYIYSGGRLRMSKKKAAI